LTYNSFLKIHAVLEIIIIYASLQDTTMFNEIIMNYSYRSLLPEVLPDSRQLIFGQPAGSITVTMDYSSIKFILSQPKNRKLNNVFLVRELFGHFYRASHRKTYH